jgi:hypothetical protein
MRRIISWEGEVKVNGILIEKDALVWDDKPLPMFWNFKHDSTCLGHATDIRREKNGSITAKVNFFDVPHEARDAKMLVKRNDASCCIWANKIVGHRGDDGLIRHVTSGHIRSIGVVPAYNAGW